MSILREGVRVESRRTGLQGLVWDVRPGYGITVLWDTGVTSGALTPGEADETLRVIAAEEVRG